MHWPRAVLWLLLAFPAMLMVERYLSGEALALELYHPTGEWSLRLMIAALLPGPLIDTFGPNRLLRGWLSIRRNLGVAAFLYALLHLAFYVLDMRLISAMVEEMAIPAIWTGWLAFAALLVPAAISTDRAMRSLGSRWKRLQRLVYPAFILAIGHWLLIGWDWLPALVHLVPLLAVWILRLIAVRRSNSVKEQTRPCAPR